MSSQLRGFQLEDVRKLMEFTNLSEREASRRLKNANWELFVALNEYYEGQGSTERPPQTHSSQNFNQTRAGALFDKYKDPDSPDLITIEGTMQLCSDLEIEPTQIDFLVLSYHLGSERMGEFERTKFLKGCASLQADSIDAIKSNIRSLRNLMAQDQEVFRDIYNYAFLLGRQNGQKSLSLEAAVELWRLLLTDKFSLLEDWITFLENKHGKAISKDTWNLFYDFVMQPQFSPDNHDAEGAWPILIDEFVEELQKKQ